MSKGLDMTNITSMTGYAFQKEAFRQIKSIFLDAQIETAPEGVSDITVDIGVQSKNGRYIAFEVKSFGAGQRLTYSSYPSIASLKNLLARIRPDNPPILAVLTNTEVSESVESAFAQSGIPVVAVAMDVNETKLRLLKAFQQFSIVLPEFEIGQVTPRTMFGHCYVTMPRSTYNLVYNQAIKPALKQVGFEPLTIYESTLMSDVFTSLSELISESQVILADVTESSSNVLLELGISIGQQKDVLLISQNVRDIPVHISGFRVIQYQPTEDGLKKLKELLVEALSVIQKRQTT
jgi:hypothetical protein